MVPPVLLVTSGGVAGAAGVIGAASVTGAACAVVAAAADPTGVVEDDMSSSAVVGPVGMVVALWGGCATPQEHHKQSTPNNGVRTGHKISRKLHSPRDWSMTE